MDIRPPIGAATAAFGLAATITPPGGAPVPTTVFWLPSGPMEYPGGSEYRRAEQLRVLVISLADLGGQAPQRGTLVAVPENQGAAILNWRIDEFERVEVDHCRAVMVPA